MEIVVVERTYAEPKSREEVDRSINGANPCYGIRRIEHLLTLISNDGRTAICVYEAPDAASVRAASEESGDEYDRIWTGAWLTRREE